MPQDADWCLLILIDAQIRFNHVFFCRSVPPELLQSFFNFDLPNATVSQSSLWIPSTIVSMQRKTPHTTELVQCSAQHDWHYSNNSELTQLNATHLWQLSTTTLSIFTCRSILGSLLVLAILKVHSFNANSMKGPSNPTWNTSLCGRRIMVYPQLAGRRQIGARVTLDCPSVLA